MRRRLWAAFLMCLAIAYAQAASAQTTLDVGVKAGANLASISNSTDAALKTGAAFGGFATLVMSDQTSVQAEVLYSMEGVRFTAPVETNLQIDMIRIPLLLRLGTRPAAGGFYILGGPAVGFVVRARERVAGQPDQDFKQEIRKGDAALIVGAGWVFSNFLAEGRYTVGLSDLNNQQVGQPRSSRVLSFFGGVRF